jgi:outer membrane protein, heavy metal efflux system
MQKTRWIGAMRSGPAILALGALAGCAHYAPKPLVPEQTLQALQARSLTDPDLLRHIRDRIGRGAVETAAPERGSAKGSSAEKESTLREWNRAALVLAALELNPSLAEARAQLEQATASLKTARAIQNPTLSLATEYDLSRAAEPPWLWGLGTGFLLDTFAGRGLRMNLAQAGVRGANADFTDAVWAVRRDVRAALVAVAIAERRVALLDADFQQRADLARLAHARIEAGESARADGLQADVELARSRAALEDARRAKVESRSKLASAIGVTESALNEITIEWDDFEQLAPTDASALRDVRSRALLSRPDLERAIADYDLRELELKQQVSAQYLQTSLGPGYTYDHGIRKATFNASVALPIFNRNEGPIAEAVAAREVAGRHALAVQAKILNEIDASAQSYSSALESLGRTRAQRVSGESLAESARHAFEADSSDRPTLLAAEVALNAERLAELDAVDRAQQALGQLEDALRTPLSGPEIALK